MSHTICYEILHFLFCSVFFMYSFVYRYLNVVVYFVFSFILRVSVLIFWFLFFLIIISFDVSKSASVICKMPLIFGFKLILIIVYLSSQTFSLLISYYYLIHVFISVIIWNFTNVFFFWIFECFWSWRTQIKYVKNPQHLDFEWNRSRLIVKKRERKKRTPLLMMMMMISGKISRIKEDRVGCGGAHVFVCIYLCI